MDIYIIAVLGHFIFDWILQNREVAKTKSKDFKALVNHIIYDISVYMIFLFVFIDTCYPYGFTILILLINIILHGLIDWFLPRIFKPDRSERIMVNMVAVDQMLHLAILFYSIDYLMCIA